MSASSGETMSVGPGAALAQQCGRDEVDGRLAPAGALDAQHPRAVVDEVADRLELMLAEARVGPGQLAQQLAGAGRDVGRRRHLLTIGASPPFSPPSGANFSPLAPIGGMDGHWEEAYDGRRDGDHTDDGGRVPGAAGGLDGPALAS